MGESHKFVRITHLEGLGMGRGRTDIRPRSSEGNRDAVRYNKQ
jgi:hypothetical protein